MNKKREIPITNSIQSFMHCARCLRSIPSGISPRDYAKLEVGFTKLGLQIWCKRHELNVCHIDFEGRKHPANMGVVDPTRN